MKSLCNRRVSVWNPDTSKEIVCFVHEVHPGFALTLSTFLHMLCGWNYDTIPTFNFFRVHLKCFHVLWFETLILRKWLSILYTKCIQFLPYSCQISCIRYVDEMMIPCQLSTFSEFILKCFPISESFSSKNELIANRMNYKTFMKIKTIN